jgi:Protein of unknown function (DUF2511)
MHKLILPLIVLTVFRCGPAPGTRQVSRADFGEEWPLTIESGLLRCRAGAVTFETGGSVYAVNGLAMNNTQNLDIGPIWVSGVDTPKKNMSPLIAAGTALCD